jgi:hypothetical protein
MRHDGRCFGSRYAARAGRKDKSYCVGAGLDSQLRVFE